jgi:hypothetical protein
MLISCHSPMESLQQAWPESSSASAAMGGCDGAPIEPLLSDGFLRHLQMRSLSPADQASLGKPIHW